MKESRHKKVHRNYRIYMKFQNKETIVMSSGVLSAKEHKRTF